jgi:hypothetical protein
VNTSSAKQLVTALIAISMVLYTYILSKSLGRLTASLVLNLGCSSTTSASSLVVTRTSSLNCFYFGGLPLDRLLTAEDSFKAVSKLS